MKSIPVIIGAIGNTLISLANHLVYNSTYFVKELHHRNDACTDIKHTVTLYIHVKCMS
jgi:hypothetical protein